MLTLNFISVKQLIQYLYAMYFYELMTYYSNIVTDIIFIIVNILFIAVKSLTRLILI